MMEDKENEYYKNYPVTVMAFKIDWVLQDEAGTKFLQNVLNSEKLELYENRTILVIIEFLYKHYRSVILKYRLPVYIFQLIFYQAAVQLNEGFVESESNSLFDQGVTAIGSVTNVFAVINILLTLYSIVMIIIQGRAAGRTYFKTIWCFFDIGYIAVNGIIAFAMIFTGFINIQALRIIEAVLSIVIIVKLIYFT